MSPRRLRLLTTGRADWNILSPLARALHADPDVDLGLVVTGGHLDAAQGLTVAAIEATGLPIAARVPWGDGTPAVRAARVLDGVAQALADDPADMLTLLGDRFETLAAAQAATLVGVPLVHLSGGDVTEGAMDDGFRHALTKLSHLHLAFHQTAARRLRQLGEGADRIHVVGNPALDGLVEAARMSDADLERHLGAPPGPRNLLVTFHPVTLHADHGRAQLEALLGALDRLDDGWTLWITAPNADPGGADFDARLRGWAAARPGVHFREALGEAYVPLVARCAAVIGNSSSGLAETPTLGVPTVDVGDRQRGRLAGPGVVHAGADPDAILDALARARSIDPQGIANPYGDGRSVARILAILKSAPPRDVLLRKPFVDLEAGHG
ncbi:MAG: UDP-N-acetylglucosamine 2-epimerase (hydrolyzing) [Alphaproteobacteria bacterium]|nr:UDP-N-acetylglucosamine 2-epimerase (hydrolyzing) [Alphaproteobacteria bacterium]MBU1525460.1 UDP-N-acetylglucosamine 2-epimerase (hydrolyzing) [Alphaproteobacteria bacterium]MBU2116714.1 UDP-N-acetylglucosamine 2-epimerase (hydrolyzing) [Alphaproteobacteria bacterium]MBU2350862.1 UDP-N-acetylglucosamine 2-epimerase (hydrolyzing) [Alphaproteobacteria bacterium]MBU2381757.1 UDP-N-acetylglucosamine 2-epimerase (hydrolyzing) [Alphaproteobacteria bacterium]